MRNVRLSVFLLCTAFLSAQQPPRPSYLYMWAGDKAHTASDFLAVIDADPASATYGKIVASIPTGVAGAHPHHTEHEMPANGHLLANGFHAGKTWLFDLNDPLHPRILTVFGEAGRFHHPHTFIRLNNNRVLAAFQYSGQHKTGGLVEMDERGKVYRSGSAADPAEEDIFPYSVLPLPASNQAISTATDMGGDINILSEQWIQVWDLAKLKLRYSVALPKGPKGTEQAFTGEPRLLADGKSVYVHTFGCGIYLLRDIEQPKLTAKYVYSFKGMGCGVPVVSGNYWLQPVPDEHALIALDITDPERPREISRVDLGPQEQPHWVAVDPTRRRVVLNSGGNGSGNRLFVIDFDPESGKLALDKKFRDPDGDGPGISLNDREWPHGFKGSAMPHGTVFSR